MADEMTDETTDGLNSPTRSEATHTPTHTHTSVDMAASTPVDDGDAHQVDVKAEAEPSAGGDEDQMTRLRALGVEIQEQDDLERNINLQADQMLTEQANERDQKRLDKAREQKHQLELQIRKIHERLSRPILPPIGTVRRLQEEVDHYTAQIKDHDADIKDIEARIGERNGDLDEFATSQNQDGRFPGESQRDFLIRTGKITPFSRLARPSAKVSSDLRETLLDAEQDKPDSDEEADETILRKDERSHVHLSRPGFSSVRASSPSFDDESTPPPAKKRRVIRGRTATSQKVRRRSDSSVDESGASDFRPGSGSDVQDQEDDEPAEVEHDEDEDEDDFRPELATRKARKRKPVGVSRRMRRSVTPGESEISAEEVEDLTGVDDGDEKLYTKRLDKWVKGRSAARAKERSKVDGPPDIPPGDEEWHLPHPSLPDLVLGDGFKLPGDIHPALFDYQKTGVQWLSELHSQEVGGIVGDEMGLGKTIQTISFLAGLHYSKKISRPIIVICPATVMSQWVNEFHTWWPAFRVSILHSSGSGMINVGRESREEDFLLDRVTSTRTMDSSHLTKSEKAAQKIVNRVVQEGHVLVTTYTGLQNYAEFLIPVDWECAVLDEGHKIRNPNASITIHCKELRTANRIILSGTPIQNNLVELWSLFDFVYPMRLGTLVNFRNEFEIPIRQGGYANASNLQVMTAAKCAETLRDSIQPYLLQRLKVDVAADLPKKRDEVVFCKLTEAQRLAYNHFLKSDEMKSIEAGKRQMLFGIDILRKICNHPDLTQHKQLTKMRDYDYGNPDASGKMKVVKELLSMWSKAGHKTLLFCQNRIMLDILQKFIRKMPGIEYRRMDGTTPVKDRQALVDEFNHDPSLHVFLLTTKVGGLGVNLTGANRVIIFDPDWNPSTDTQARERAWRLGQKREVEIYRLMTKGTIEEKILHRQIFKQFLTNKILKDPKQRQTFQMKDLYDLFTLGDDESEGTETGKMFKGTETVVPQQTQALPDQPSGTSRKNDGVASESNDPFNPSYQAPKAVSQSSEHITGVPTQSDVSQSDRQILSVKGIAGVQDIDAIAASGNVNGDDGPEDSKEQRLLSGIFARSGVTSTVEHDRIVNGRIEYAADARILTRHAEKIAAQAAKSLRDAEKIAKQTPVGVPTWTGETGSAGRPPSPPPLQPAQRRVPLGRSIGGAGSASVLNNLRARQTDQVRRGNTPNAAAVALPSRNAAQNGARAGVGGVRRANSNAVRQNQQHQQSQQGPTAEEFGAMIRDFLLAHGGSVFTQMLLDQFSHRCKTDRHSAEFKAMLNEIATLQKGSNGRGRWTIKPEYRPRDK